MVKIDIKEQLSQIGEKIVSFFTFVASKLKNFKNISLGEQLAYCSSISGLLLILVSLVMFIL